jgi:hypothetical protein
LLGEKLEKYTFIRVTFFVDMRGINDHGVRNGGKQEQKETKRKE